MALGAQSYDVIASRLHEMGDHEAAEMYERLAQNEDVSEEGLFTPPHEWLFTEYEYGFIKFFEAGSQKYHEIIPARNMPADLSLRNQQIDVHLDWLYAYAYPPSLGEWLGIDDDNVHTILFSFEAHNQHAHGHEHVAFNQTYKAKSGQSSAVTGLPIFLNINVGTKGISFSCKTMNVSNSSDRMLVDAIGSPAMRQGLKLLTAIQPALAPFVGVATGLFESLKDKNMLNKNVVVHDFMLGLDFETGASGIRLAVGTYVVVQVPHPNTLTWSEWKYDAEHGTIVKTNWAVGEKPHVLGHNALLFRVSKSQSGKSKPNKS